MHLYGCHPSCIKKTGKNIGGVKDFSKIDVEAVKRIFFHLLKNYYCRDCIENVVQHLDMSYESMKKDDFNVWFIPLRYGRRDVLELLLMYGVERYEEY